MNLRIINFGVSLLLAASGCTTQVASVTPPAGDGIRLRITEPDKIEANKTYRVAVLWVQLSDEKPNPTPELVYDAPLQAKNNEFTIPLPAAPSDEANLLCERACDDESTCKCLPNSKYKIGLGLVTIAEDVNGNGKADLEGDKGVLSSNGLFVHSATGGDQLPPSDRLPGETGLIDGPVETGVHIYEAYEKPGSFDRLRRLPAGGVVEMRSKSPNIS